MDEAIPEAGGYKWKFYTCHEALFYRRDVTCGAAGVGTFLLLLYEQTGNSTYLDYAKGAAQWVISQAVPSHGGYLWLSPDDDVPSGWRLSCDVAGIGEFFLKMYRITGNSTYLDYAKGAAQWMMAMAEYEYGGCFIPYNPPGKTGSQASHGIGPGRESYTMSLLLHLYQETANTTYLPYIKGMAQWLTAGLYCKAENGGYKWLWGYPYESVYAVVTAARVVRYFYETYQVLGNETYLHYANGGVQWILSQAVVDNDKVKWPSRQGASDYLVIVGDKLLHGIAVVSDILLMGYSVTGNTTYLEYAKKHTNWILSQAVSEGDGYRFDNAYRNAIIYRSLCDMFNVVKNVTYSQYADGTLIWITNNATTTNGEYKWRTSTHYPYYLIEIGGGASGIGYHLISAPPIIPKLTATTNIDPDTLNLKSKGKYITCYIELPEGYDVNDIDVSTVMLNDTIPAKSHPTGIGDEDEDGIPDLMVKFSRPLVINYVESHIDWSKPERTKPLIHTATLTITGTLYDGTPFEGSDTIRTLQFLKGHPEPE